LLHHRAAMREAASDPPDAATPPGPRVPTPPEGAYQGRRPCSQARQERLDEASRRRHERVVAQYEAIRRLHAAGADVADIARAAGVSRRTVYRYRELAEPPAPQQPRPRAQVLDPYVPYPLRRWAEGCHNGLRLYREIVAKGMTKSEVIKTLAEKTDVDRKTTVRFMDNLIGLVVKETKRSGEFLIPGLGKAVKANRKARMGRNPATGEAIKIKASKKARITPLKGFKDAVMSPAAAPKLAAGVWPPAPKAPAKKKAAAKQKPAAKKAAAKTETGETPQPAPVAKPIPKLVKRTAAE